MLRTGDLMKAWEAGCELADAQLGDEGADVEEDR